MEKSEEDKNKVKFTFYQKPMAPRLTVLKTSALSWVVKKLALAGEVARQLLNCSKDLTESEGMAAVEEFVYKMLRSGYQGFPWDF